MPKYSSILLLIFLASPHALVPQAPSKSVMTSAPRISQDTFDVASIRPTSPDNNAFSLDPDPDAFILTGATLRYLVDIAFGLHKFQLSGLPQKIASLKYDVVAKVDRIGMDAEAEPKLNSIERQLLLEKRLRHLLIERFGLKFHWGSGTVSGYALVKVRPEDKGGVRGRLMPTADPNNYSLGPGFLTAQSCSIRELSWILADQLNTIVVDETGLTGNYGLSLRWSYNIEDDKSEEPLLPVAIKEQLGLELRRQQVEVPILIVESVHVPTDN